MLRRAEHLRANCQMHLAFTHMYCPHMHMQVRAAGAVRPGPHGGSTTVSQSASLRDHQQQQWTRLWGPTRTPPPPAAASPAPQHAQAPQDIHQRVAAVGLLCAGRHEKHDPGVCVLHIVRSLGGCLEHRCALSVHVCVFHVCGCWQFMTRTNSGVCMA